MTKILIIHIAFYLVLIMPIGLNGQGKPYKLAFPADEFSEDALLDLSYLNEDEAGENGFIQLSEDGNSFVNGNGEEMRFWAIGGGAVAARDTYRPLTTEQLAYYAKFLAKKGVNMIRYHGAIHSTGDDINQVNIESVKDIWRLVAAMKKEGIYTTISPFWAGHMGGIPPAWELGDYAGNVKPWALMFFDEKFKNAYKNWVEYLYTEINPYTGLALKDDPAVAIIQIKNEDGLFFWTIQDVRPSLMASMENRYSDWLINRYGSIDDAYMAWGNERMNEDDPVNHKMGLYIIWEATQEQTGGKHARLTDQINFYSDVQRGFYQEIYDHYRSIGCKQLINGNNWKTASPTKLLDAERWTNEVGDVIAVNRYVSPGHIGPNSGWRIEPGHQFVGNSVMRYPHKLPINVKQVEGRTFIVSESAWNLPHKYQAEGPFLIASYMSLTGFDAYYWFNPSSYTYDELPYFDFTTVEGQMPMFRWTVSTPGQIGMFPANALMFRKGYIQESETIIHEERTLQSIYEREVPIISEDSSFDPNRDDYGNQPDEDETNLAPIAYLAGRVSITYNGDPTGTFVSDQLTDLLDFQNKRISSTTGELTWDYEDGLCILNAPAAKGICGFPTDQQVFEIGDVIIETSNEYIVVNVVAMDELPISQSRSILIQIGTIYRPTLWKEEPSNFELGNETVSGYEITNVGKMPWRAERSEVTVSINNPNIQSARVLDMNGYHAREIWVKTEENNDMKHIMIPEQSTYIIADDRQAAVLGLDEVEGRIRVYPNPADGLIRIEIDDDQIRYTDIEVVDLSGKVMRIYSQYRTQLDLDLPEGAYLLQLKNEEQLVFSTKIIVGS